jgi:hypothetical protein
MRSSHPRNKKGETQWNSLMNPWNFQKAAILMKWCLMRMNFIAIIRPKLKRDRSETQLNNRTQSLISAIKMMRRGKNMKKKFKILWLILKNGGRNW